MKFLIQRTTSASVEAEEKCIGKINKGYLVLIGINDTDTFETADKMLRKMLNLRIFEDSCGKTNLSLSDVNGGLLLISQFTLYADCRRGNRPGFTNAGSPDHAEKIYDYIIKQAEKEVTVTEQGSFGADMKVTLVNDGPFTILLDSDELFKKQD